MKYVISAEGAKAEGCMLRCKKCGGTDHIIDYCRCHDGKEIRELRCVFCKNKIKIELEEVK